MLEDHVERREDLRFEVDGEKLRVTVGFLGFETTTGAVLDISRGGMKVCLEGEIPKSLIGEDCLLRFVDPQGRVNPEVVVGKLRRMEEEGQYTIEFNKPLEGLRMANGNRAGDRVGAWSRFRELEPQQREVRRRRFRWWGAS